MQKVLDGLGVFDRRALTKTLLCMKLTALFLLVFILKVGARGYAQTVTLSENHTPLSTVFREIKKQTGYSFFFDESWIKEARTVTIEVKGASLATVLDLCFQNQPLTYTIVGNTVVVKPKDVTASPAEQAPPPPLEITGAVTDANGKPLEGVSVRIKGSTRGVTTNEKGEFTIHANTGETLQISYVGYFSKEVKVSQSTHLRISLDASDKALSEVVVSAFGIQKKQSSLGYATTTITGSEIEQTNTINPITALQGKVAGVTVNVMTASGVQTSPYIQIRGAAVLSSPTQPGNNQPIFVIDGNVLQNNLSSADGSDPGSQLKDLNPDDYESITVLKGAAATAAYGSRGINGAIIITTKSGRASKGIGVEYSTTYSLTDAYRPFMDLQNTYGQGTYYREGAFKPDGSQDAVGSNWGPAFDGSMHPAPWNLDTMVPYVAQPNNWKTFYQNGHYLNNNVTVSGAGDNTRYRLSYSNTIDDGTLVNNGLKRNAVDLKISGKLNSVLSYDMGINYANTITRNLYNQSRYAWPGGGNVGFTVYYYPRNVNFAAWHASYRNPDNSMKNDPIGSNYLGEQVATSTFNQLDKNNYTLTENSILAFTQIKAQVTPWLDFSGRGNINYLTQFGETKDQGSLQFNQGGQYAVSGNHTTNYELVFMGHATAKAIHNDLSIDMRVLNDIYGTLLGENYSATTEGGLQIPNVFLLSNSVDNIGTNQGYSYTVNYPSMLTVGVAGIVDFTYKDYLSMELTGRNDWLSTLTYPANNPGANNYSVFYPSVNASYQFYNHLKNSMPKWMSAGRVWGNFAEVGNSGIQGAYATSLGYQPGNIVSVVNPAGQSVTTATPINDNIAPNPNLKPQIQRGIEFGTDLNFLKDRIHVNFDWYKNNTTNQLIQLPGIMETGHNTLLINAGNIQNKGIELELDVTPFRNKDWYVNVGINLGHNASQIKKFYPGITSYQQTGDYEGAQVWSYQGGAYGVLQVRGSTAFQLDPKTGYPIMMTTPNSVRSGASGDSVNFANYQYAYDTANLVTMGKIEPNLTGGFSINLRYKNFTLFTQIDGRFGGYVYSESYTYAMGQGSPKTSLQFRDKAHGGVARTDSYTGQTVYDGAVPNGVFAKGQTSPLQPGVNIGGMTFKEAYEQNLVAPWYAPAYYDGGFGYAGTYDWENGLNYNGAISKESWVMFREITLGYQIPSNWISKLKVVQGAKLTLSVRNLGYLYNSLPDHQNPASITSNNPQDPFITGGVPFERNYSATLNVRF